MISKGLGLEQFTYTKGLHDLGGGLYAWLQPDGSWGLSNAGLVIGGNESLLVDTLYDFNLTSEMLDAMRQEIPQTRAIEYVINTHSNGDHCNGNGLVFGAEVISSEGTLAGMHEETPEMMLGYLKQAPALGDFGVYFQRCFGRYNFEEVERVLPSRTFKGKLELTVGDKKVELIEVGPAHTAGDTIVYVPDSAVVFSGDILFIEGHPLMWKGPLENWLKALQLIMDLQPKVVVPGHGPITDVRGVQAVYDYFVYIKEESRMHFDQGHSIVEAAQAMVGKYAHWSDAERITVNIAMMYRAFKGDSTPPNMAELFGLMANFSKLLPASA